MIIKCLAIDDEPPALARMSDYINKTPFLELAGTSFSGNWYYFLKMKYAIWVNCSGHLVNKFF